MPKQRARAPQTAPESAPWPSSTLGWPGTLAAVTTASTRGQRTPARVATSSLGPSTRQTFNPSALVALPPTLLPTGYGGDAALMTLASSFRISPTLPPLRLRGRQKHHLRAATRAWLQAAQMPPASAGQPQWGSATKTASITSGWHKIVRWPAGCAARTMWTLWSPRPRP